jgi:hypothetical protein
MRGRHAVYSECIEARCDLPASGSVFCAEMEASDHQRHVTERRCRAHNPDDAWVGAAGDDDEAIGGLDDERLFDDRRTHLASRAYPIRYRRRSGDLDNVRSLGETGLEGCGERSRHEYPRVRDACEYCLDAARVVRVLVRQHEESDVSWVDVDCSQVVGECVRVAAGLLSYRIVRVTRGAVFTGFASGPGVSVAGVRACVAGVVRNASCSGALIGVHPTNRMKQTARATMVKGPPPGRRLLVRALAIMLPRRFYAQQPVFARQGTAEVGARPRGERVRVMSTMRLFSPDCSLKPASVYSETAALACRECHPRRGGRVVECGGLENRLAGIPRYEGSNPSLSARYDDARSSRQRGGHVRQLGTRLPV